MPQIDPGPLPIIELQLMHQMIYSHRGTLSELVRRFEELNPHVRVRLIYRETEELRSSFQTAAVGGSGPDIIYGPSDMVGVLSAMGLLKNLDAFWTKEELADFDPRSLPRYQKGLFGVGDMVGNFLMLIFNKKLINQLPKTFDEFISVLQRVTRDLDGDGKIDQWGLVFNATEPFFFVPWVFGFGSDFLTETGQPQLNSPGVKRAFELVRDFRTKYRVMPLESDYETANSLFKEGRAAVIVNGDWSWGDYRQAGVDFDIQEFPKIEGYPAPLVGTKLYAINKNVDDPLRLEACVKLVKFLVSTESQIFFSRQHSVIPSRYSARKEVIHDPFLQKAIHIMEQHGRPMPIHPELRAIWDTLRKYFQATLTGQLEPEQASNKAQEEVLEQIQLMNQSFDPDFSARILVVLFYGSVGFLLLFLVRNFSAIVKSLKTNLFVWIMLLPALLVSFLTIFYPFIYNFIISFSNLNLVHFNDWKIIGIRHYLDVLTHKQLYWVLLKTIFWTAINLLFHVGLGIALAIVIDRVLPLKSFWRTLLIISWAVPQYIAALTWRGMFHQEYGAINQILFSVLGINGPAWLVDPLLSMVACIVTNVWLGFPFMMMVALGALKSIPESMYEAASLDGAGFFQQVRYVALPMILPVMKPAIFLGAFWTFNNFNVVWLVSNGGEPADATHILVTYIYKSAFNLYRYSSSAAYSMILFLILLVFTLAIYKLPGNRWGLKV
ncbi:MAG: extracellular solute-binding protein [Bdellovibrionaceae bacterium]|nr:extracellular solute-binding protein [Pseudobdellovibrionaceae bacterium]MDW8190220.1 extracellular solute-binding protein [Pseudobdellovibrionaceae bacterium]